jgi:hypothetical protein
MPGKSRWRRHVDDSLDELSPFEIRALGIPTVELVPGQMIAGFQDR